MRTIHSEMPCHSSSQPSAVKSFFKFESKSDTFVTIILTFGSSGDIPNLNLFDFNKMEYLECFIKEVLRMYPSVPFLGREVEQETVVNGLILPKSCQIHIHTFDIMRDPKHFPNPSKFDPDRFLPENTTNRHPYAFVPFSAGPRNCIGENLFFFYSFFQREQINVLSTLLKPKVIKRGPRFFRDISY